MSKFLGGGSGRLARCRPAFCAALTASTLIVQSLACAWAAPVADAEGRPAAVVEAPSKAVIQAIERAGDRLVAVGERGLILLSDDNGTSWRQAPVPVSIGLTAVQFPTPRVGWAVGHFGTVLHSRDAGETWQVQLTGEEAAARVLAEAQALPDAAEGSKAARANAERLVEEGPDKPFLGVLFSDERNGLVVGAFNLILRTTDGGQTWTSLSAQLDNPGARHLYAIAAGGDSLYIVGEEGRVYRSDDNGARFTRLRTPYQGSYFTVSASDSGAVVVAGLRGNAFRSTDRGETWAAIELPSAASVVASRLDESGRLWLLNQAGQLLEGRMAAPLRVLNRNPLPPPTGLAHTASGDLLVSSLQGIVYPNLPSQH
ncbi:WD40/YVTN/BNR-like repeat-containing protein [Stutzerimonas chloritidismutans]|uniref:WD40/YVTN/BNR-like repeat-containing protein n=1 Tax=Stutzerimonas chloritidismutans TaxID=203192 RepID=UPI003F1581CA